MSTIDTLEQQSTSTLVSLLDDMFASCDDLYFDLASAAANNHEQNTYFESMREVRVRSASAKQTFEKQIKAAFERLAKLSAQSNSQQQSADAGLDGLSIVDHEETERQVALTGIISRARAISRSSLFEVESRLQELLGTRSVIDQEMNPVDPEHIINGFATATDDMELELNARIILYKQFERLVIRRLPEFYDNFNKRLDESGAKFTRAKAGKSADTKQTGVGSALAGLDEAEILVNPAGQAPMQFSLSQLSGLLRGQGVLDNPRLPMFKSANNDNPISTDQLLNLLNSFGSDSEAQQPSFDLRSFVASALKKRGDSKDGEAHAVKQMDEDVINLVSMFFDFALEDDNIPDNVKALLSRLQMPTLKYAIKDPSFFSNTEHPAREFINRVAQVSIGLNESDRDTTALLDAIENWIQDIQLETENIEGAFNTALSELEDFSKKISKRSELVEKRTHETAEGEAIKQVAKLKAQQAIEGMLDGKEIDQSIANFITDYWQRVLYNAYMRSGNESSEWTSCLQLMQDLAWSAQPHSGDQKALQRLDRILEDLQQRLEDGLKITSLNAAEVQSVATATAATIASYRVDDDSEPEPSEAQAAVTIFIAAENEALDLIEAEPSDDSDFAEFSETADESADDSVEDEENDPDTVQKIQDAAESGDRSALNLQRQRYMEQLQNCIQKAEQMETGTWLEFKVPSEGTTMRCKLALKIQETQTFVFVNRFGFKSLEKSKKAFAQDLQRNRARVLKSGPLFDRSLGSVIRSLQKTN